MDNKKISIDDLFRQRLADREAPLPPGSWSRMEGLLDARIPTSGVPVAASSRRRGRWALVLLGLLVAGGGSFLYQSAQQESAPEAPPVAAAAATGVSPNPTSPEPTALPNPVAEAEAAIPSAPLVAPTTARRPKRVRDKTTVAVVSNQQRPRIAPVSTPDVPATRPAAARKQTLAAENAKPQELSSAKGTTPALSGAIASGPAFEQIPENISPLRWVSRQAVAVFSGKAIDGADLARVENYLSQWAAQGQNPDAPAPASTWSAKIPENARPSISASGPPAAAPLSSATQPQQPLSAAPTTAMATATGLPPAVEQQLGEAVEALQKARFTFGLLAGINSTMSAGTGALQGLHAGIVGLLKLSEKWQLGAELRSAYRLNNSMDLRDDYFSGKTVNEATVMRNGKPYYALRYEIDSMLSRYSFNSYSSLELPLLLRYNHKRISVFGGPGFAFHFAPNVTRSDTRIATISRYDTLDASLPLPQLPGRTSDVSISDFGSRFSLGYQAGAQYRLTPALHLDLRLSQQLWDSRQGSSVGARRVSDTYIHIPTVQLSVGYHFGVTPRPKPAPPAR